MNSSLHPLMLLNFFLSLIIIYGLGSLISSILHFVNVDMFILKETNVVELLFITNYNLGFREL